MICSPIISTFAPKMSKPVDQVDNSYEYGCDDHESPPSTTKEIADQQESITVDSDSESESEDDSHHAKYILKKGKARTTSHVADESSPPKQRGRPKTEDTVNDEEG